MPVDVWNIEPNTIIDAPNRGERIQWITPIKHTQGAYVEFDHTTYAPAYGITHHRHNQQEETYTVVSGSAKYHLNYEPKFLSVGETVVIPPHTIHTNPINANDEPLTVRRIVKPDYGVQSFYTTWFSCIHAGKNLTPTYELDFLQLAVISQSMAGKTHFAAIPAWIQDMSIAMLALVGRLRGDKVTYPDLPFPFSIPPDQPVPNKNR